VAAFLAYHPEGDLRLLLRRHPDPEQSQTGAPLYLHLRRHPERSEGSLYLSLFALLAEHRWRKHKQINDLQNKFVKSPAKSHVKPQEQLTQ
jgi:hypothetical protein